MRRILDAFVLSLLAVIAVVIWPKNVYALDLLNMPIPSEITAPGDMLTQPVPVQETAAPAPVLTYIDVSIDTQTLTYYVNGAPVLITPCVTGKPGRGTPRGVFAINSCIPGKYLNGPTWHVWVNRWMRFCGNVGIHDATWRKSFGGDIYKTNGSHGCVNIPHDQAVQLYSMVGVGTPVIVH